MAMDAVQMRRQLETMASQMRRMHTNANQQQRQWEDKRKGQQERMEKMMYEARRAIGHDIHREMVANERVKLAKKRAMPNKLRKHAKSWSAFEADIESGVLDEICLEDIPFPPHDNPLCARHLCALMPLYSAS